MAIKDKLLGSKADRDELTKALEDSESITSDEKAYEANQDRIRKAEAKLPVLGRVVARDRSI